MKETKERMCDAQECSEDCTHCEHAGENNGVNLDNLSVDDLKELFRSQKILVDALVAENESLMKQQEENVNSLLISGLMKRKLKYCYLLLILPRFTSKK